MNRSIDPAKKNEQILMDLLKQESNKYCADCGQKGTRWASWNIGVFLCIRCGGLHRSLGTHISRVKSVTLDKWTDEQVESIKSKGNAIVNQLYNPHGDRHPFPTFSGDMENYIRDKYERKLFMDSDTVASFNHNTSTSNPMVLKRGSLNSPKTPTNNLMDMPDFKVSTPELNTASMGSSNAYDKQLSLLSEMGFNDTEFNLKTLKAANGNMQDALEIIVAANHKLKQSKQPEPFFDEWATSNSSAAISERRLSKKSNSQPVVDLMDSFAMEPLKQSLVDEVVDKSGKDSFEGATDPWSSYQKSPIEAPSTPIEEHPTIEQSAIEQSTIDESDNNDPLAFNPFKSSNTTHLSDDLFANPW